MDKIGQATVLQAFTVLQRICPGANNANVMGVIKKEVWDVMGT